MDLGLEPRFAAFSDLEFRILCIRLSIFDSPDTVALSSLLSPAETRESLDLNNLFGAVPWEKELETTFAYGAVIFELWL